MKLWSTLQVLLFGAIIVCPGASRAAPIVFDVSGVSTERSFFFDPQDPSAYHATPFSAGSSLTLETDANGDGVQGDYTVVDSRFEIHGSRLSSPIPELGETGLTWDIVGEIHGGSGHLEDFLGIYEYIRWSAPGSYSVTGTWQCHGWTCAYQNLPDGVPMPYSEMLTLFGMEPIETVALGSWATDGLIPTRFEVPCNGPEPNSCHGNEFGLYVARDASVPDEYIAPLISLWVQGEAVPEPTSALLVPVSLLALALGRGVSLRGRASDTMRRHEVG